jgi:hypothetical protein
MQVVVAAVDQLVVPEVLVLVEMAATLMQMEQTLAQTTVDLVGEAQEIKAQQQQQVVAALQA